MREGRPSPVLPGMAGEERMTERIDELLGKAAALPADRDLRTLEPLVWQRIEGRRADAALMPRWRFGLAAASMALGVLVGVAGIPAPPAHAQDPLAVFSTSATLAPSTLIVGAR